MTPQDTCLEALRHEQAILLDDPEYGINPDVLSFCREIEAAIQWVNEQSADGWTAGKPPLDTTATVLLCSFGKLMQLPNAVITTNRQKTVCAPNPDLGLYVGEAAHIIAWKEQK